MLEIIVDRFGAKKWHFAGVLHREDGPAIEKVNGDKYWWFNGKLHREDGPAAEYINGAKLWYLDGKRLTKEAWFEMLPEELKIKALFGEHFIKG